MTAVGKLVAVGRTSDVYEFGRGSVVKVLRPMVPNDWAATEAHLTVAVRELGAPAPQVLDIVQVDGRDAIVFERVGGSSMWDLVVATPRLARTLARELAEVHKHILHIGLPADVAGVVERMCKKIEQAKVLRVDERNEAQHLLKRLPKGAALLHGDLHPANILMSEHGPVVIDWYDAAIGHPVADVVRSSILVRPFRVAEDRPHLPDARPGFLNEFHESYLSAMSGVISSSSAQLRQWEAVVAATRLAEDAESDHSALLSLWRSRDIASPSPLVGALSAVGGDQ